MNEAIFFAGMFLLSVAFTSMAAKLNRKNGIIGKDINKFDQKILPEAAGIGMVAAIWLAIVAITVFFIKEFNLFYFIFGLLVTAFAFVGLLDDTKHKFMMKATPWAFRAVPIAFISLLFGAVNFHNPFWAGLIALFVAGLASLENTFAGLNGWEIGSGFIISIFVTLIVSKSLDPNLIFLAIALNGIILGLLYWNRYPAKAFPGDSGTLFIGSAIAAILVMNQNPAMLLLGFLFFLPHLVDFFGLKLLTNPKDLSQSKIMPYALKKNGMLSIPA